VTEKNKDNNVGYVEYDMDEDTSYRGLQSPRSPPISSQGKQPRVLLE